MNTTLHRPADEAEAIVDDPQSLPLDARIRYYASKMERFASAETFRQEVLFEVYRHLLEKSRQQKATVSSQDHARPRKPPAGNTGALRLLAALSGTGNA